MAAGRALGFRVDTGAAPGDGTSSDAFAVQADGDAGDVAGARGVRTGCYSQSRFLKMRYRLTQTTAISRIAKG